LREQLPKLTKSRKAKYNSSLFILTVFFNVLINNISIVVVVYEQLILLVLSSTSHQITSHGVDGRRPEGLCIRKIH